MKKYLYLIALIMLTSSFIAMAQDDSDEGEEIQPARKASLWGVKAGLNFTSFANAGTDSLNIDPYSSTTGILLGVFYRSDLMDIFSYQVEFSYSTLGSAYISGGNPTTISYLNLGALAKYYPLTHSLGANLQLGLQYGYLLGASERGLDIGSRYNTADWDLLAGAGFDFGFGLTADVRFLYGLMITTDYINNKSMPKYRNIGFQVQVGWGF